MPLHKDISHDFVVEDINTRITEVDEKCNALEHSIQLLSDRIGQNYSGIQILRHTKEDSLGNPSSNGRVLSSTTSGNRSWIDIPKDHNILQNRNSPNQHNINAITGLNTALAGKESVLGNPSSSGRVLSSTTSGNRSWIDIPKDHNILQNRNSPNQHSMGAISGLSGALNGKESVLGNPSSNGQILASTTSGVRSWINLPTAISNHSQLSGRNNNDQHPISAITGLSAQLQDIPKRQHYFHASNQSTQSFSNHSMILTPWDHIHTQDSSFERDPIVTGKINIHYTGRIQVWAKVAFENNTNLRVFARAQCAINGNRIPRTASYCMSWDYNYYNVAVPIIPGVILDVEDGQNLQIFSDYSPNNTNNFGTRGAVVLPLNECMITIKTLDR